MKIDKAKIMMAELADRVKPHCLKLEIAGDIRREKYDCQQFDIVVIPIPDEIDNLYEVFSEFRGETIDLNRSSFQVWIKEYSIFVSVTRLDEWACKLIERTGSNNFYRELAIRCLSAGYAFKRNRLWKLKYPVNRSDLAILVNPVTAHSEEDVFRELGLDYIKPERREYP